MASTNKAVLDLPLPHKGRWYCTARFWKRLSVAISILLSAASLILSAFASLQPNSSRERIRVLTVSGVVVNSISIAISALTSLDWKFETTNERQFAEQLLKIVEMQEGEEIIITRKGLVGGLAAGVKDRKIV